MNSIIKIKEITQKEVWEDFLMRCDEKTFLSSWNWGEFQKKMGSAPGGKIWRLGIYENSNLAAVALIIKITAKRGSFLLLPHNPVIITNTGGIHRSDLCHLLLEELKKIARKEDCSFIRIAPIWERNQENIKIFKDLGFRQAPIHMHPEASWKLDISESEKELLMNMRKTTRYLIKQAQKNKDLEVFQTPAFAEVTADKQNLEDIEIFNNLYQKVVKSQHFIPFSLDYLKQEFLAFQQDNEISLFFVKYKEEIIASAFVLFWSKIGFYHHAALSPKYHKIPAAYLLQWEAIKEAKKRGCVLYDFWGYVNPKEQPKHPWAGPTLFKMGFGGKAYEYIKTQDLVLSSKYWLTYIIETIRKKKRGL
ncbi:peptidoglycan bridge formation glycyltransferase FemA/FemB family protein [Candidatus Parcubacteria bacterium]|nr:peptidoglycan bridge formation glycyltransferase FemA/FemB family protein [Candidatus Parcubacteria bacterium]